MTRRQRSMPQRWLIVLDQADSAAKLQRGTGILLIGDRRPDAHLRIVARTRGLVVAAESAGEAARVHELRELRRALLARCPMILLSPIFPTASHPDWTPIPRLRAAALAQLARRHLFALGGMTDARFRRIRPLGFQGWAGIGAFRT